MLVALRSFIANLRPVPSLSGRAVARRHPPPSGFLCYSALRHNTRVPHPQVISLTVLGLLSYTHTNPRADCLS